MGGEKKNKVETGRQCCYSSPGKRGKVAGMKFVAVEVREDHLKRELHNPVFYWEGSEAGGGVKDDTQVSGQLNRRWWPFLGRETDSGGGKSQGQLLT